MSTWVGIDPGERRIGMARSDPMGMIAQPAKIVESVDALVATVTEWAEERDLAGVVVGFPLNMSGTVGPIAERSLVLVRDLRQRLPFPVRLWDERLSSQHVGKGHRSEPVDDRAAAVILQAFLDAGTPDRPDPPELAALDDNTPQG